MQLIGEKHITQTGNKTNKQYILINIEKNTSKSQTMLNDHSHVQYPKLNIRFTQILSNINLQNQWLHRIYFSMHLEVCIY